MTANQNTMRTPARDYEVGYGKPPVHTRFQKGQSGNPSGRPKKQERAPLLDGAKELALKEAARMVTIREGGKVRRMPALQAVYRSQFASAIKGNGPAARAVIKMVQDVESEYGTKAEAQTDSWMEYKIEAQRKIADRQRRGLPIDDIKPHPDDILVDLEASRVWFRGDIWPDDAAKVRELGLLGQSKAEHASPANDDEPPEAEYPVSGLALANILSLLDFEPKDSVLEAYTEAQKALDVPHADAGPAESGGVKPSEQPTAASAPAPGRKVRRQTPVVLHILNRLEPEYHDAFRDALAAYRTARGRLLEGVPWPRPTYAGIPATAVADLALMCTAEHLKALASYAERPTRREGLRERSRSNLDKRLGQLAALLDDPTLPTLLRAEIENALNEFRLAVPGVEATARSRLPENSIDFSTVQGATR